VVASWDWLIAEGNRVTETSVAGIAEMVPLDWAWSMEWSFRVLAGDLRPLK
jgi:hypothetical protein